MRSRPWARLADEPAWQFADLYFSRDAIAHCRPGEAADVHLNVVLALDIAWRADRGTDDVSAAPAYGIEEVTPMTQREQEGTPHPVEAEAAGSDAEQSVEPLGSVAMDVPTSFDRPPYFDEALDDAERLLKYAAEIGIAVDDEVRDAVLRARTHGTAEDSEETTSRLLIALTNLAALLAPVTAESLKACVGADRHAVQGYWKWAIYLAAVIVPFSVATFVTSGFSDAIRKDIASAGQDTSLPRRERANDRNRTWKEAIRERS